MSQFTFASIPLTVIHSFINEENCLVFNTRNGQLMISTFVDEIQLILNSAYGQKTIHDICSTIITLNAEEVLEVCNYLLQQKILIESRELYLQFQIDSSNPPMFYHSRSFNDVAIYTNELKILHVQGTNSIKILSPEINLVQSIILNRSSSRDFSDDVLSFRHVSSILQVCTRLNEVNSIPHAGGINGITIYIAIHKSNANISAGMYVFEDSNQTLSKVSELNKNFLISCLDAEGIFPESGITLFVTSNFNTQGYKYANRAFRNSYIEAGHISQNVQLYCAEENLAVLEYSGFQDQPCSNILGLNFPNESVLIVLFVGVKSKFNLADKHLLDVQATVSSLKEAYLGSGKILKFFVTTMLEQNGYYFPNIIFDGRYGLPNDDSLSDYRNGRAFATSMSHNWAFIKGCAEALERYSSSQLNISCVCSANDLDASFIHPYSVTPWHENMFKWKGLTKFSNEMKIEWAKGYNLKTSNSASATANRPTATSTISMPSSSSGTPAV